MMMAETTQFGSGVYLTEEEEEGSA